MRPAGLALLVGVIACGAPAPRAIAQGPAPAPRVYVTNQESATVSVLDARTGELLTTIDLQALGFSATAKPHDAAVEPDGSFWYVTLIGDGRVLKFDRDNRLVGQVATPVPGLLSVAAEGDLMVAGRSMAAVNPPTSFAVIRRSDMTLLDQVDVLFPRPHAIILSPDGRFVYTASLAENRIAAVDLEHETVELLDVPGPIHTVVEFALSPDGRWLAGTAQLTGNLFVWDLTNRARPALAQTMVVGRSPWHPSFTRNGCELYVPNLDDNTVSVIETRGWTVTHVIRDDRLAQPHGSTVAPDGRVFISNRNQAGDAHDHSGHPDAGLGRVVVIDPVTHTVVSAVATGRYAAGTGSAAVASGPSCR